MKEIFLVSVKTLKESSILNQNIDEMYLYVPIKTAQDSGLQPIIGTKLYNKLMDLVEDGSITGATDYKYLLDEYVTQYLVNKVTADIQIPLSFKLRNQGVVQQTGENTYVPSLKDIQYVQQHYQNQADFYSNRMSDYLRANRTKYPEYCSVDSCADMRSNKGAYNTGIFLG